MNPNDRKSIPLIAFVLGILAAGWWSLPAPAAAADKGTFSVVVEDVSLVMRSMRTTQHRTFRLRAPADQPISIQTTVWPGTATIIPPDTVRDIWFTFSDLVPLEESDEILDVCQQHAMLVQAKPDKYRLSLFIEIPDADDASLNGADDLRVSMRPGYYISCSLVKL